MKQRRLPNVPRIPESARRYLKLTRLALVHQGEVCLVGPEGTVNRLAARLQAKGHRVTTQWHPGLLIR